MLCSRQWSLSLSQPLTPLEPERPPIRLFEYQPGRNGDYAVKFLEGFHGVLIHDQFPGYNKLDKVTHAGCWAHLRRQFVEVASTAGKNDDTAKDTLRLATLGTSLCRGRQD